ncbi:MAG: DUF2791 family P-loop domain-containing protein [Chloroflexi bacterium]|nr:DUF2791 family P-loop domain-containing protein [Chloroflexota bacterium]
MKSPRTAQVESLPGLAGREREFALLNVFLWRAMAGQGQMAFVTGAPEANSRAFVEGVLSQVQKIHPSLVVALGECRQGGESLLPFIEIMHLLTGDITGDLEDNAVSAQNAARLREMMESSSEALMKIGPDLLDKFVPGSKVLAGAAAQVVGKVPWLEALRKEKAAPKINQERIEEGRLYEEYGDVLVALARHHPLVLGLVDLQWADPSTLTLLFHLSRRLKQIEGEGQTHEIPMLVVGTYRPAEIRPGPDGTLHPLKSTLNEIVRYYGQVTIPLDRSEPKGKQKKSRGLVDRLSTIVSRNQEAESSEPPLITEVTTTAVPFVEQTNVFVGRSREMGVLQRFLQATLQGKGQVAFVTGEPGAGKSTLIKAFTEQAQKQNADLVVAVGECNAQTGAGDAYLPFREVLGMLTGDVEAKLAEKTITPENANRLRGMLRWTGSALVEVGPDLIDIFVPGSGIIMKGAAFLATKVEWMDRVENIVQRKKEQPVLGQRGLEQAHLYEQYTNVICKLATRNPLILVLDDLQWGDEASISLLFHLARRISESKIFIIGMFRPNDVAMGRNGERHPLEQVVTEIKRYNAEIELNLDKRDVATEGQTFVSEYIDVVFKPHRFDPGFKKLIFQRTQGHALFTVELLRSLQERAVVAIDEDGVWYLSRPVHFEDLPARVDAVVGERIARLQSELRDILTIASVEGQDFTAQVVARIREMDDHQLATRLTRELDRQHHLIKERGSERVENLRLFQWHFSHTLFQEHLYRDLGEMERIVLHRQVAKYLEELYGPEVKRIPVQLSRHFLEAEVYDKAFKYLKLAGEQAQIHFANEEAISYFRSALDVVQELTKSGLPPGQEAIPSNGADHDRATGISDTREEQMEIHEHLGDVLFSMGNYDEALEHYSAALKLIENLDKISRAPHAEEDLKNPANSWYRASISAEQKAALLRKVAQVYERKGETGQSLEWLVQAQGALENERVAEMARICIARAGVLYRQGEVNQALEWCQRGLEIAQDMGERGVLAHAYMLRGAIYGDLGDIDHDISDCEKSLAIAEEIGDEPQQGKAHNNLGVNYYYKGNWEQTLFHYNRSLEIRERIGDANGEATVSNNLGELHLIQGRFDEAGECFKRCLDSWQHTGYRVGIALSYRNLALVCLKREQWDTALVHLESSLKILQEIGSRGWLLAEVHRHLAEVYLGLNQPDSAQDYAQKALDLAVSREIKLVEGSARRVLGQLYRRQSKWEEAELYLRDSLRISEEVSLRHEAGQALWELALMYQDKSKTDGVSLTSMVDVLNQAITIFSELGAQWDLERAQRLKEEIH